MIIEASKVGALDTSDGREILFTRDEMSAIGRGGGRPVLVYLNLTKLEPWRDYWPNDETQPPGWGQSLRRAISSPPSGGPSGAGFYANGLPG
ncbi:hypothetical protein ACFQDR_22695 [Sulfitobacter sediminilitoris]